MCTLKCFHEIKLGNVHKEVITSEAFKELVVKNEGKITSFHICNFTLLMLNMRQILGLKLKIIKWLQSC